MIFAKRRTALKRYGYPEEGRAYHVQPLSPGRFVHYRSSHSRRWRLDDQERVTAQIFSRYDHDKLLSIWSEKNG